MKITTIGRVKWYNGSRGYVVVKIKEHPEPLELPFSTRVIGHDAFLDTGEPVNVEADLKNIENPVSSIERTDNRYIGIAIERSSSQQFRIFCMQLGKEFLVKGDNFTFDDNKFIDKNEHVSFTLLEDRESVGFVGKVDTSSFLSRFAIMPRIDDQIRGLSEIAIKEDWKHRQDSSKEEFPVLLNYIRYLFVWHINNDTIEYGVDHDGRKIAAWNTGLTTPLQEEIFAYYLEPRGEKKKYGREWMFYGFLKASERRMGFLSRKPELAKFYDNPSDLVYDLNLRLEINADHILRDNIKRFPVEFRNLHSGLPELLKAQEHKVVRRVRRNYRTAVPQYSRGRIQLLLPVFLRNDVDADVALLLDKTEFAYRAVTVLTLPMAYNNARLVTRPASDWL